MAKTQRDQQSVHEKNQESALVKKEPLQAPLLKDGSALSTDLAQAAAMPGQALPGSILSLQENFGNTEVRRAIESEEKPVSPGAGREEALVNPNGELNSYISSEIQRARGGGAPLQAGLQTQVEQRFGRSFAGVRIHHDHQSDQISRQLQARAFTVGNSIFFRQGAYAPHSPQGHSTLLHELTHVLQQSSSAPAGGRLKLGPPGDRHEQEAERFSAGSLPATQLSAARQSGSAVQQGVVQRDILDSIKGLFGKGNTAPPPPHPATTTADEWVKLQKLGVPDIPTWDGYSTQERDTIKTLMTSEQWIAGQLIAAKQGNHWPANENNHPIFAADKIKLIAKAWISFEDWETKIKKERRKEILEWTASNADGLLGILQAAKAGQWPQDENNADLTDITKINLIQFTLSISFKDWKDRIVAGNRKALLDLATGKPTYLGSLVTAALGGKWPKDDQDAEIKDDATLKKLFDKITWDFVQWSSTKKEHRAKLFAMVTKPYVTTLFRASIGNTWPKDGNNNDIDDVNDIAKIIEKIKLDVGTWNGIAEKAQRGYLLANADKTYINELARAAAAGKYPQDGAGFIYDDGKLNKIKTNINLSFFAWGGIANAAHRGYLFDAIGKMDDKYVNELAQGSAGGLWPKDGADADISDMTKWGKIKAAAPGMPPSAWNGLDMASRGAALAEADDAKRKQIINSANYKKNSQEGGLEKAGTIAEHAAVDTTSGLLSMTSSILSAAKGTTDNTGLDIASGTVGAVGDTVNAVASGTSFLGSIARYYRGKQMAEQPNYSRAAKKVGEKEQSKGSWGAWKSGTATLGSISSLTGNLTKAIGAGNETASGVAGGFQAGAGALGMLSSGISLVKQSMSANTSRERSAAAQGFIKKGTTAAPLSADQQKLNQIAEFTSKNQNKLGKGLGIFKTVTSFLGGAASVVGGIGGIFSKEVGMIADITSASLSGAGILGGLLQFGAESKNKPKDAEIDPQVDNLIALLRLGSASPEGKEAARFVKEVLKIDFINLADDKTWVDWIDEDEQAAKDLIKSKMAKF